MAYTVVGLFDSLGQAASVVDDLLQSGVERDQISLISARPTGGAMGQLSNGSLPASTAAGALVGGLGGLLMGLGALAIPGIGPILAAGPLAATILGAGVGATGGALLGALQDIGVPEIEAGFYAESIRRGATLMSVTADDTLADAIAEIMDRHGASDIGEKRVALAREGWREYDDSAGPYAGPMNLGSIGAIVRAPGTRHQRIRRYRK